VTIKPGQKEVRMKKRLLMGVLATSLAAAMLPGAVVAGSAPNQGNPAMVLTVDNPAVACGDDAVAGTKVEGGLGRIVDILSDAAIDKVTIKSGRRADDRGAWFSDDGLHAWVELSKDVSNYVVWSCPPDDEQDPPQQDT